MNEVKIGGTYYVWLNNGLKQVDRDKKKVSYSIIIGYCTPIEAVKYLNNCFNLGLSDEDIKELAYELIKNDKKM